MKIIKRYTVDDKLKVIDELANSRLEAIGAVMKTFNIGIAQAVNLYDSYLNKCLQETHDKERIITADSKDHSTSSS